MVHKSVDNGCSYLVYYVYNGETKNGNNQRLRVTRQRLSTGDDTVHTPYTT